MKHKKEVVVIEDLMLHVEKSIRSDVAHAEIPAGSLLTEL